MYFPIGGPLEASLYSNGLRDIQWRMWRNDCHDLYTTSKQRSRSFILVPIDFLYIPLLVANSNFCSRIRTPFSHNTSRYRYRQTTTTTRDDDARNTDRYYVLRSTNNVCACIEEIRETGQFERSSVSTRSAHKNDGKTCWAGNIV